MVGTARCAVRTSRLDVPTHATRARVKTQRVDHRLARLNKTGLQPGVGCRYAHEAFHRLFADQTVETVFSFSGGCTGLKPGVIKNAHALRGIVRADE
jgi:hypothetical protein